MRTGALLCAALTRPAVQEVVGELVIHKLSPAGQRRARQIKALRLYTEQATRYERQLFEAVMGMFAAAKRNAVAVLEAAYKAAGRRKAPLQGVDIPQAIVQSYLQSVEEWSDKVLPGALNGIMIAQSVTPTADNITGLFADAKGIMAASVGVSNPAAYQLLRDRSVAFRKEVVGTTEHDIRMTLAEGMQAGESVRDLAGRIQQYFESDTIRNRAAIIARTESIWASSAGQELAWQAAGVVEAKEWLVTEDDRLCEYCIAVGKMFNEDMGGEAVPLGRPFFEKGAELNVRPIDGAVGFVPDCKGLDPRWHGLKLAEAAACLTPKDRERAMRALASYKPQTRDKFAAATASEHDLAAAISKLGIGRVSTTALTAPFDVVVYDRGGRVAHVVEVKTIVKASNDKITMHKSSLQRKREALQEFVGAKAWTFVWDKRQGRGDQKYLVQGLGSFRLDGGVLAQGKVASLDEAARIIGGLAQGKAARFVWTVVGNVIPVV